LNYYREKYISEFLSDEIGELSELEKTVLSSLKSKKSISEKIVAG